MHPPLAAGEYGLTSALMKYGYNVDTLMAMYRGVRASFVCLSVEQVVFGSSGLKAIMLAC